MQQRVYEVSAHARGWQVKEQFAPTALAIEQARELAVSRAREMAVAHQPSRILVFERDGTIGDELTFDHGQERHEGSDAAPEVVPDPRFAAHGVGLRPLAGTLGAELAGIDLSGDLDPDLLGAVRDALVHHKVLVARDQRIDPADLVRFGRSFGELEVHTFFPTMADGLEQVTVLDSRGGYRSPRWHTDESFLPDPPIITILHAQVLPEFGDDTLWADMEAAYDALSPRLQHLLDGLTAVHDMSMQGERNVQLGQRAPEWLAGLVSSENRAEHPVVVRHPESGRRGLYLNPTYTRYIVGLPIDESKMLLDFLFGQMGSPHIVYRHRWQPRDLVVWDNRSTIHLAVDRYRGRRVLHRVSVLGSAR